ncbi:unnamed protein product [Cuscuta epithymum]|uniref:Uncharacterized protein n=1 Tax=Cuscuta epithymum TaxID=186058 RepID=A0AAV0CG68_9ASTE|nr:unnamed protein product [Cuscuta epithymum]
MHPEKAPGSDGMNPAFFFRLTGRCLDRIYLPYVR